MINAGMPSSWEYCVSLWFELRIMAGEYPLKWPLVRSATSGITAAFISSDRIEIPYFLARYSGLASLIAK